MFANVKVNGFGASLLWKYLAHKKPISGCWTKFLVDKMGDIIKRFEPNSGVKRIEEAFQEYRSKMYGEIKKGRSPRLFCVKM